MRIPKKSRRPSTKDFLMNVGVSLALTRYYDTASPCLPIKRFQDVIAKKRIADKEEKSLFFFFEYANLKELELYIKLD